ncbi:Porin subfamily protein [Pseudovibrio ascidiaceicola]|uniref:Porin n=1 Tax=Pseudovibrio ascidiaceicola TaxID=285279 RepID=A0A1I4BP20_9HYPH|nr:porin [Pseudovibrio ascidiaceicola]SFK69726.1 Porin subfamily protein [Pseudovibrio ascidiaceicola]
MNFKKIAIAAAAAAAATPAMAADLPVVAEPVNYVQACDAFGAGYFQLPGQDTCVRVHGRIRTQWTSHDLTESLSTANPYSTLARGYVYLESMTATEMMSIKTYTELTASWDESSEDTLGMGDAYLQLGFDNVSVLLGRTGSVFNTFGGYSEIGVIGVTSGGEDTMQISASTSLGNGFTAEFALEDAEAYGGAMNRSDFVGALSVTQGMFTGNVSAAAHAFSNDEYGFAVAGSLEVAATDAVKFGFGATYAKDALAYAAGSANNDILPIAERLAIGEADEVGTTSYVIAAGVEVAATDKVTLALDGSYANYDIGSEIDFNQTVVNGSIAYAPVAGMVIALDAGWTRVEAEVGSDDFDGDSAQVAARVQYSF